jgi:hypothetical protein
LDVTEYEVIAAPPLLTGAVHDTAALVSVGFEATTLVGLPATVVAGTSAVRLSTTVLDMVT